MNPALARLAAIKARSGSGMGRSFDQIPTAPFSEPIAPPVQPSPIVIPEPEPLPPLEDDTDELRVADRLIALQAAGLGAVAPTNANRYNRLDGQLDSIIGTLKEIDPRNKIQSV
jgi:hypothetical protein